MSMERDGETGSVTIAAGATTSGAINTEGFAFGKIFISGTLTGTTFTWQAYDEVSESWVACYEKDGTTAITADYVTSRAVRMPDLAFPAKQLRILSDSTESNEITFAYFLSS